jgi:hypothetical protein
MADIRTITLKANSIVAVERDTHQLGIPGMSFVLFKPYLATRQLVETIEEGERIRVELKDIGGAHTSDLVFIWDGFFTDTRINTMVIEVGIDDLVDDVVAEPTADEVRVMHDGELRTLTEAYAETLNGKLNAIFGTP